MPKRNLVWIAILAVIAVLLWKVPESLIRRDTLYTQFSPLLDVVFQVRRNYVEETQPPDLLHGAIDGMLGRLDPYSQYFNPTEYDQFQKRTEGQFVGIGIEVGEMPGVGLQVVAPIEGTPAYRAGLRSGDRIIQIDGEPAAEMKVSDAVKLIQGKPGTTVTLTIERPGVEEPFEVTITRSLITVRTVRGWARSADWQWDYLIDPEHQIGYVRISSFEEPTADQLDEAIRDLVARHRMRGLILDLRDNPGGLLPVVVNIARRFVPSGVIVSTKGRNKPEFTYEATGEHLYPPVPVVVLVNHGSASASEILAGALRDHGRGMLVGEKTFGKGSVQELILLSDDRGAIKLTTAYYYLPKGERIHGKGVVPDRIVDLSSSERTKLLEANMAVYSTIGLPSETQPATATAPATMPATAPDEEPGRVEILIDRQLREALSILQEQLATRPAA
jgi:carboxyl-terminal processing protease